MESIKQIVLQEMNEQRFNRKHIDAKIREEIINDSFMQSKIKEGIGYLSQWMNGEYYASKQARINQLKTLDLNELVIDLFVGIAYFQRPELFTSATAQLASRLKFSDKREAITSVAEMVAVLCETDVFDINKESKLASLYLVSNIPLSEGLIEFVLNSQYLPPMVCEPLELTHNYSSGYLTHNDSLILGSGNHHNGDICLDVLNTMNKVALKLNTEFLSTYEEKPTFEIVDQQQAENWDAFKKQSYKFYDLMVQQGNKFYLTHKVDMRGRIYSCGYHIHTQGTAFKKASLEFSKEEMVEGVPN